MRVLRPQTVFELLQGTRVIRNTSEVWKELMQAEIFPFQHRQQLLMFVELP